MQTAKFGIMALFVHVTDIAVLGKAIESSIRAIILLMRATVNLHIDRNPTCTVPEYFSVDQVLVIADVNESPTKPAKPEIPVKPDSYWRAYS